MPRGIRTPDTLVRSQVLCPLSYGHWWNRPELNRCNLDFQSSALPAELQFHVGTPTWTRTKTAVVHLSCFDMTSQNSFKFLQPRFPARYGCIFGTTERIRTADIRNMRPILYLLSYRGIL